MLVAALNTDAEAEAFEIKVVAAAKRSLSRTPVAALAERPDYWEPIEKANVQSRLE